MVTYSLVSTQHKLIGMPYYIEFLTYDIPGCVENNYTCVISVADVMSRNRLEELKMLLHTNDKTNEEVSVDCLHNIVIISMRTE